MATEYLYGAYGKLGESVVQDAAQAGTIPVYFGTAPVNLIRDYSSKRLVNYPVRLYNIGDVTAKVGNAQDWQKYTLCEAFKAHFDNPLANIGPIVIINVMDPDVHRSDAATTASLTFVNGRAEILSETIIIDTFALDNKVEGVDYILDYNFTRGALVIYSADRSSPLTGTIEATYYDAAPEDVTTADIIGEVTPMGEYSGIGALGRVYPELNAVPNLLLAPGWSQNKSIYDALVAASQQINGHWNAMSLGDIPIMDGNTAVDTIPKAKAWRTDNGYTSEFSKVCWPMAEDSDGRKYHMSTWYAATMQKVDTDNDNIPMETPANKQIPIARLFFGENSPNQGYDQQTANELTKNGISTAVFWGGQWVLWGDHTAAYSFEKSQAKEIDPRSIFDVSVRMLMYIANSFQIEWGATIDKGMTRQLSDRILNREQQKLDALVAVEALIGNPVVVFIGSENPLTNLIEGQFRWDHKATPTPPAKALSAYVRFTDEGYSIFLAGGDAQ